MLKSFLATIISLWAINSKALGLLDYTFSTGNTYDWGAMTANSTANLVNGKLVITMAQQASGKYRGDLKRFVSTTVHAGNYPIFAIKFNKPPHGNIFFDTNLGSYNNRNNNQSVMKTSDNSRVFYWDMFALPFGTANWFSTTNPTILSFITIKVADIVPISEQLIANSYTYDVDWIKTFPSVNALRAAIQPKFPRIVAPTMTSFKHPGALHNEQDIARMKNF